MVGLGSNRHVENLWEPALQPTCWVLLVPQLAGRLYGPFASEENAMLWAAENMPERLMFQAVPVFDKIRA